MKKLKFGIMLLVILTIIVVLVACQPSNPTPQPAGKVTVVFELNGGEMSEATTVQVDKGSYLQLPVPTHTGYTFLGWFVGEGVNAGQVTDATAITQDITITAHWEANNYTVSFVETGDNAIGDIAVTYDQVYALPNPIRTGYTFVGWYDGENKVELSGTWTTTSDVTLVAHWQANTYTVTFETGTEEEIEPMEVTFDQQYTLPTFERIGYTLYWCNGEERVGIDGVWSIADDVTLVASWQEVNYAVAYNNVEDCYNANPTNITISQLPYTLKDAGKNDHVFEGWYSDSDFTTRVTQIDRLDMTLYAKFSVATSGLQFSSIYNGVKVTGYNGTDSDIIIPSYHDGFVTSIGSSAFENCSSLTSIVIPSSVTSIGDRAFYICSSLTSIVIPSSVTSIGDSAFLNCRSLTSIVIPSSVTSIGDRAFSGCRSLSSITVEEGNDVYHSEGNCLIETASRTLIAGCQSSVIPADGSVTSIGDSAFSGRSSLMSIIIPSSVTSIGDRAFSGCRSLTSIVIPSGVTSIGGGAFLDCSSLTSIVIPSSVTSLGGGAFENCSSLSSITVEEGNDVYHSEGNCLIKTASRTLIAGCQSSVIPADGSVTSIGYDAFSGHSSLMSIIIPSSVTSIGYDAFYNCSSLTSIVIPSSVTSIGEGAFSGCSSLSSITVEEGNDVYHSEGNCLIETASGTLIAGCQSSVIPADGSVTSIGDSAFSGHSSLMSIIIPSSITSIRSSAFYNCSSLTSIVIPSSVTSIGGYAFYNCSSLTSIVIPSSVTSIGKNAFYNCSSLTSIVIPSSVTSIGDRAFSGCRSLSSITVEEGNDVYHSEGNCLIETASRTLIAGCQSSVIPADGSVTSIGYEAFSGHSSLMSIIIPSSVTSIGGYAFYNCSSLTSIVIPSSVTSIGYDAFYNCSSLTIYCEAESQPEGWDSDWNPNNCPVVWGYKG